MKKAFLLLSFMYGAVLVNAQEATTYRGAFAPAPAAQWTDTWTNFNPQATVYPATNVTVTGSITSNTTWTKNNVYLLNGLVYVNDGVTLTIEAGTIIRGSEGNPAISTDNSSLIIARGGKLMAEGTVCNPIIFTSNKAAGQRAKGDWGGVIILGKATCNQGTNVQIEGTSASEPRNYHGGNDDNDYSGILKYVRIEYPGFIVSDGNEINGLTLGSVGSATTIDYVQVSFSDDDSFEWFGGSVNCTHLVAFIGRDDDFDTDFGYHGMQQFLLGVRSPTQADQSQSNGFESDNTAGTGFNGNVIPKTSARVYNATMLGGFRCGFSPASVDALHRRGAHLRRNTDLKIYNSIFLGWRQGVQVDAAAALANVTEDSLQFRNNLFASDYTANTGTVAYLDAATRNVLAPYGNDSANVACSSPNQVLVDAFPTNYLNADYRPNPAFTSSTIPGSATSTGPADLYVAPDLANSLFAANASRDLPIAVGENGVGAINSTVTLAISKLSSYTVTVPGLTLSGTPQSGTNGTANGTPTNNGDWNFYEDANNVYAVLKTGKTIAKSGSAYLGFTITRKAGTSTSFNVLSVEVSGGGDVTPSNNIAGVGLTAN